MNANLAVLAIRTTMDMLNVDEENYAIARRRDGSVSVVALNCGTDCTLIESEEDIMKATAAAGHPFRLVFTDGFPALTNRPA